MHSRVSEQEGISLPPLSFLGFRGLKYNSFRHLTLVEQFSSNKLFQVGMLQASKLARKCINVSFPRLLKPRAQKHKAKSLKAKQPTSQRHSQSIAMQMRPKLLLRLPSNHSTRRFPMNSIFTEYVLSRQQSGEVHVMSEQPDQDQPGCHYTWH